VFLTKIAPYLFTEASDLRIIDAMKIYKSFVYCFRSVVAVFLSVTFLACTPVSVNQSPREQTDPANTRQSEDPSEEDLDDAQVGSASSKATTQSSAPAQATVAIKGLVEADSLRDRLLDNFSLDLPEDQPQVQKHVNSFAKNPAQLNKITEQAEPYLHYVTEELELRQMPGEIALLPIIESAYNPHAVNRNAVGFWQLQPATAKRFGVTQSHWFDGRRDIQDSTQGALNYLEYLGKMFDGDWLLALAAYNSGEGTVLRAIKRNKASGKPIDFWSLPLPSVTKEYVPRLLALSSLIANDEDYFAASLFDIPNEATYLSVEVDSPIHLQLAANLAGMSLTELKTLNPGIKSTRTLSPLNLYLPVDKANRFLARLEDVPVEKRLQVSTNKTANLSPSKHYSESKALSNQRITHTVRSGDSLWKIANQYRVSVQSLVAWNKLNPKAALNIGQSLTIWKK